MNRDRLFPAILAGACVALLGFGYYLQYGLGLEPCPLCILQRVAFFAVAVIAIIAAIHAGGGTARRIYSGLIVFSALAGGGVAARQVWLQHLPADQVPACGPGLDYMLQVFPWTQVLDMVLKGSGECAEKGWVFLSLSIAEWSLFCFVAIIICTIVYAGRQ